MGAVHLLIPFASTPAPACHACLASLSLPNLRQLLLEMQAGPMDRGDAQSLSPPHERYLARAKGLPVLDGQIAWAAAHDQSAWAFVTPCHWRMGQDHVTMTDPQDLQIPAAEAQALLLAMLPYFAEDGIELLALPVTEQAGAPTTLSWRARADLFRTLACASLDRVSNRDLSQWMPRGEGSRVLRRLQSEMQMLLYTHPVNEARQQRGLLPVNSFWASGCGALPAGFTPHPMNELSVDTALRRAALADDAPGYASAWQHLDAGPLAALLGAVRRGQPTLLALCGERACATWASRPPGAMASARRLLRQLRGPSIRTVLESL